jgi:hypothetical protein
MSDVHAAAAERPAEPSALVKTIETWRAEVVNSPIIRTDGDIFGHINEQITKLASGIDNVGEGERVDTINKWHLEHIKPAPPIAQSTMVVNHMHDAVQDLQKRVAKLTEAKAPPATAA